MHRSVIESGDTPGSVLLIEDDARVRRMMVLALARDGFDVVEAATGEAGLEAVAGRAFDAVCVDLMLPGVDGFAVCRDIRRGSAVPIIIITARTDCRDVVEGLEAGADDYVRKPFAVPEFLARVRALLRRASSPSRTAIRAGELEITPQDGLVLRRGKPVELTRLELRLLCRLADPPGRVFSREELLEQVWGYDYFGDSRLVDVHVGRLRRKVEADPREPRIVVTERGRGYRLGT
jgi:DNA-binding response OmpR family regulator